MPHLKDCYVGQRVKIKEPFPHDDKIGVVKSLPRGHDKMKVLLDGFEKPHKFHQNRDVEVLEDV